jgi:hypothetical protein
MNTPLYTLIAVLLLALGGIAEAEEALLHREVNEKNPGGKDLVMTFQEMRRDEKTSTVKTTMKSGASVPSSMFIVRGFYDIAKARGATHFIKLKEWKDSDGASMYLVGFSRDKGVDPKKYFGLAEPLPKSDELQFMAVKDFDLIFKPK